MSIAPASVNAIHPDAGDDACVTALHQNVEHLQRTLQQVRSQLIAVAAERDGLLSAMRHLAAPVIPIAQDVVVMPLLGDAHAQRAQAESLILRQTTEQAHTIDGALSDIARDAEELADCARQLFEQTNDWGHSPTWNARTAMFRSTEGQFVNGAEDLLSVFVPNWVDVDEALLDELNTAVSLGPILKVKQHRQSHSLCTYIFTEHCRYMAMYPNSDPDPQHPGGFLADQFAPDLGIEGDPVFWTIADEKVNPARIARWTAAYFDNAGEGLMVSAIAPIYTRADTAPCAMIGIDVGMEQITAIVEAAAQGQQRAALLVDEAGHLVVASEQTYAMLGMPRPQEMTRGAALGIDLAAAKHVPSTVLAAMQRGETGVELLHVGELDVLLAYAPVPTVGWSLGVITPLTSLSTNNGTTLVSELIDGIQRHRARLAVLDATGVVSVDHQTVRRILEGVQTARLIGAEVYLAGVTPSVAQMILALGVNLSQLHCYPDLRSALRIALR